MVLPEDNLARFHFGSKTVSPLIQRLNLEPFLETYYTYCDPVSWQNFNISVKNCLEIDFLLNLYGDSRFTSGSGGAFRLELS